MGRSFEREYGFGRDPGNLGTNTSNSGLVLKQSDLLSSRVELELGSSTYKTTILADAPTAYYRLDETSGTNAIDSSGNGNTATYSSTGITYGSTGALANDTDTSAGFVGASAGTITVPSAVMNANTGSVEFWVNPGFVIGGSTYNVMFSRSRVTNFHTIFDLYYNGGNGDFQVDDYANGNNACGSAASAVLTEGSWAHIVMTYDVVNNKVQLFVNGSLFCGYSPTNSMTALDSGGVTVFGMGDNAYVAYGNLTGSLDEAAIYSYVLSNSQITAHYQAGLGKFYPNPVLAAQPAGYWRLGESGGTVAYDVSGNGNNGIYENGVTSGTSGALNSTSGTAAAETNYDNDTAATFVSANGQFVRIPTPSTFNSLTVGLQRPPWIQNHVVIGGSKHTLRPGDGGRGGLQLNLYPGGEISSWTTCGNVNYMSQQIMTETGTIGRRLE